MIGVASVGLGIGTTYGLCGFFGIPNTPMNSILPFLLLGIGIDDMFVIVQSFTNIKVSFIVFSSDKRICFHWFQNISSSIAHPTPKYLSNSGQFPGQVSFCDKARNKN